MKSRSSHLITGLKSGKTVTVQVNGKKATEVKVSKNGVAYFEVSAAGKLAIEVR